MTAEELREYAQQFARQYITPLYGPNDQPTHYEVGAIRQAAAMWLAGAEWALSQSASPSPPSAGGGTCGTCRWWSKEQSGIVGVCGHDEFPRRGNWSIATDHAFGCTLWSPAEARQEQE